MFSFECIIYMKFIFTSDTTHQDLSSAWSNHILCIIINTDFQKIKWTQWTNLSKLEKGSWVSSKIINVKHCLGVWKIRKVNSKSCINPISGSKVWYSTWNRHLQEEKKNHSNTDNRICSLNANSSSTTAWYQSTCIPQHQSAQGSFCSPGVAWPHLLTCWYLSASFFSEVLRCWWWSATMSYHLNPVGAQSPAAAPSEWSSDRSLWCAAGWNCRNLSENINISVWLVW